MSEAIIAALIGAVASIIVNLINNNRESKKRVREEARKEKGLEDRLESIEKKLDVHNGYAEKLGSIQIDIAVIKNEVENLERFHRGD